MSRLYLPKQNMLKKAFDVWILDMYNMEYGYYLSINLPEEKEDVEKILDELKYLYFLNVKEINMFNLTKNFKNLPVLVAIYG